MLTAIIIISILLTIVIVYLLSVIINMNKIIEQIHQQNNFIDKHDKFLIEQYKINVGIMSKLQQLEDNNTISYLDYLKSTGKMGQA